MVWGLPFCFKKGEIYAFLKNRCPQSKYEKFVSGKKMVFFENDIFLRSMGFPKKKLRAFCLFKKHNTNNLRRKIFFFFHDV